MDGGEDCIGKPREGGRGGLTVPTFVPLWAETVVARVLGDTSTVMSARVWCAAIEAGGTTIDQFNTV